MAEGISYELPKDYFGSPAAPNLRDYFAAKALAGGLEQGTRDIMDMQWWHEAGTIAKRAYAIADAMLKERAK